MKRKIRERSTGGIEAEASVRPWQFFDRFCKTLFFGGQNRALAFPLSLMVRFVLIASCIAIAQAEPAWVFNPPKTGRALYQGGWMVECPIGVINASSEFSFPLQLIYLNSRDEKGMFGSQWFCPQLESSLIPKGAGVLVWTMPSGDMVGFKAEAKRQGQYLSLDGSWRLKANGAKQIISDGDGWQYAYAKGRLESITSPTGRVLDFVWSPNTLQSIQIRDPISGARRVLAAFGFNANKELLIMQLNGQQFKFGYFTAGQDDHLAVYAPPLGDEVRFSYDPESNVLTRSQVGKDKDGVMEYSSVFVKPFINNQPSREQMPEKNAKNYWLTGDRFFQYAYGKDSRIKDHWLADQILVTAKAAAKQQASYFGKRGVVTTKDGEVEQKKYYYVAPGQKYDGKIRRIEENGALKAEYHYDHDSGLLTEIVDGKGVITFYDYPEKWKPLDRDLWEPKPIRVRQGSRQQNEVIAEISYDVLGRVATTKDKTGTITRYTYTPKSEIASITDLSTGSQTSFTYDEFGRRTSVTKDGLKESVEYDPLGRIQAQVSPDGIRTEFNFDKNGLISGIKRNGKDAASYVRDAKGGVIGEKDALGRMKKITRDSRGNLLSEIAPNGSVTRYEYDDQNRRTAQIDGNGNKTTFAYDLTGHLVKQVNSLGETLTWKYDEQGHLVRRTNGEQSMDYIYDKQGKLVLLDYGSGQKIYYVYDDEGRIKSQLAPQTKVEYIYDKQGRVDAQRMVLNGEEELLRYRYSPSGRRTGLILARLVPAVAPSGSKAGKEASYEIEQQTEYTYDPSGRLTAILSNGESVVSYKYDSAGRLTQKTLGNGIVADISYDSMGHLAKMAFSGGNLAEPVTLAYEWDAAGQVTARSWNGEAQRYQYDANGQLLKVIDPNQTNIATSAVGLPQENPASAAPAQGKILESYSYDKAGNMIEKIINGTKTVMNYNAANQLINSHEELPAEAGKSTPVAQNMRNYAYDKAGRLINGSDHASSTYGWLDKMIALNRLGGSQINFDYWPDGQLADKHIADNGAAQPGLDIRAVSNEVDSPLAETFLWDGLALLRHNDRVYITEPHPSGGVPIASYSLSKPTNLTYYLSDFLGTTLASIEGGVAQFTKLTAFGQPLKMSAVDSSLINKAKPDAPNNLVPSVDSIPTAKIK